ncbi:uncharacterized protein PHACADRAFT_189089, partial [Phanerochaete carnosa HHB-10118-sp]
MSSPPDARSSLLDSYPPSGGLPYELRQPSPSEQVLLPLGIPSPPTGSSWGSDDSIHLPPSPTLSTTSFIPFTNKTTLALRDNNPYERSGVSPLGLLSVHGHRHGRARKNSNASTLDGSTEDTESDSNSIDAIPPSLRRWPTPFPSSTTMHKLGLRSSSLYLQEPVLESTPPPLLPPSPPPLSPPPPKARFWRRITAAVTSKLQSKTNASLTTPPQNSSPSIVPADLVMDGGSGDDVETSIEDLPMNASSTDAPQGSPLSIASPDLVAHGDGDDGGIDDSSIYTTTESGEEMN